jgi:hypothetical protein
LPPWRGICAPLAGDIERAGQGVGRPDALLIDPGLFSEALISVVIEAAESGKDDIAGEFMADQERSAGAHPGGGADGDGFSD